MLCAIVRFAATQQFKKKKDNPSYGEYLITAAQTDLSSYVCGSL